MAAYKIYHKNGSVLADTNGKEIEVHSIEYNGTWMGECFVTVTFENEAPIDFSIGDYIVYRNERFEINYDPGKIKCSSKDSYGGAFKYDSVKFNALSDELVRCDMLDLVLYDNNLHYTALPQFAFYVESLDDLLDRIQANLDDFYGKATWKLYSRNKERSIQRGCTAEGWESAYGAGTADNVIDSISISISDQNCWDALSLVNSKFDVNFIIRDRNVYVGTAGVPTANIFKYGKDKGLYEIEQNSESDQAIVTRLRAYGSNRNLPNHYYADLGSIPFLNITGDYHAGSTDSGLSVMMEDSVYAGMFTDIISDNGSNIKHCRIRGSIDGYEFDGVVELVKKDSTKSTTRLLVEGKAVCDAIKAKIDAGIVQVDFISGANKTKFNGNRINYVSNLPNNMACDRLMLPGFPNKSLSEWWNEQSETKKAWLNPGGKNHDFSGNRHRPYVDSLNIGSIGVRPASVFFDQDDKVNGIVEIYPTIEGMEVDGVRIDEIYTGTNIEDDGRFGDGETVANVPIYLSPKVNFDIRALMQEDFTIHMKDGMCAGREFKVAGCTKEKDGSWKLMIERKPDSSLGLYFPYNDFQIKKGDHFVLTGIELPDAYVEAASEKLLKYCIAYLDKNDYTRYVYQPKVDEIFMARQHDTAVADSTGLTRSLYMTLKEGDIMLFKDDDLGIDAEITIDQLTIKEEDGKIPTYEITLREEKEVGTIQKIQNQISSIVSGNGGAGTTGGGLSTTQIKNLIDSVGSDRFLSKLNPDTAAGIITFLQGIQFANTLLTDIVKSDDWRKIMDDTQLVTGGGMEKYVEYVISLIADKYLRRDIDDEAKGLITFLAGLKSDDLATFLSGIEVAGLAVFKNTLSSETFVSGWSGYGWRLLMKEVMNVIGSTVLKSELEVDELTVRGSLRAFEFIINQLRGENDNFVFAGMQKVQSVNADNKTIYLDTNKGETYCPFTEGDILRCQRFQTGGTIIKQYDILVKEAHVGSLSDGENRIDSIVWEAFSGDINDIAQGDVLCRLDNNRDPERKGIITTTSVGSNSPYIDVIYGLITNPKESLKVRLGKLDGIVNELLGELSGYGLYSNNAFLTGEFYLSTGEAVATKIKMLENLFSSSMSKTTYDIKEDDNIVTNCAFVDDMRGWTTVDGDDMDLFFIDDDTPVFMNDDMFSDGRSVASLENVQGKDVLHLLNAGVSQDNALYVGRVPADSEVEEYVKDSNGNIVKNEDGTLKTETKTIRPTIYITYRYMCKESGSLSIGFNNGRTTQYSSDMGAIVSVDELGTLTENVNANDGVWIERQYKGYYDKLGDFSISTTGEVYIDVLAVTSKPLDDYKNVVSTQLLQQYNVIGFYGKNIDANKQEYTKLYSVLDAEQKKIVNFVGTENLTNGSTVSSLITQSANSIKQTVAETYATKTQVSTIEQTASNISLVVEQTRTSTCDVVYNNNVTIKTDASGKTMAALSYTITPTFLIANEAQTITSLSVASGSGSGNPRLSISGKSVVVICDQGATLSSPKMLEAVASVTRSERQVDGTTKNVTYKRSMFITVSPAAKGDQGNKGDKGDQGIQGIQGVQGQKGDTGAGEVYTLVDNGSYATLTAADSLTFYLAFVISKTVDGTSSNIDSSWYSNHKVQYKSDSAKISNWTDIALSSNSYAQTILNAIAFDASSYNTTDLFMVRLIETSSGAIMADFTVPLKLSKGAAISITDNRIKIQVLDSDKWAKIDTTANRIEAVVSDLKSKTGIDITNGKIEISSVDSSGKPTGNFIVNTGNFKIKSDGTIECSNGIFSGKITATSGKIGVVNISSTGALVTPYWNITADGKLWCSEARIIGEITATSGTFDNCTINETCKAGFMNYTTNKLNGYVINCGLVNYDNLTNAQKENLKLPSVPSGSFLNVRVLSFLQTRVPVTYTLSINDANGVFADNEYFNVYNTTYKTLNIAAGSCYNFLGVNINNRSVWISLDKALPRI